MDIRPVTAVTAGPQGLDALAASAAPAPTQDAAPAQGTSTPLEPAVRLDIGSGAHEDRFIRDRDTSAMVFQVVDPASGEVLAQLPSETALRNRAYEASRAQTSQAPTAQAGGVSRIA